MDGASSLIPSLLPFDARRKLTGNFLTRSANDITDVLETDFTTSLESFGVVSTVDLVPGGADIAVTEENKQEYIALVCEHRLRGRVEQQLEAFRRGVNEIVPAKEMRIFDAKELEVRFFAIPFDLSSGADDDGRRHSSSSLVSVRSTWRTGRRIRSIEGTRKTMRSFVGSGRYVSPCVFSPPSLLDVHLPPPSAVHRPSPPGPLRSVPVSSSPSTLLLPPLLRSLHFSPRTGSPPVPHSSHPTDSSTYKAATDRAGSPSIVRLESVRAD